MIDESVVKRILCAPEDCFYAISTRVFIKRVGQSYHVSMKSEAPGGSGRLVIPEGGVNEVVQGLTAYSAYLKKLKTELLTHNDDDEVEVLPSKKAARK